MKLNKKTKRGGIIAVVLLAGLIGVGKVFHIPVLSTGVNYILYPFEKGITFLTNNASDLYLHFKNIDDLIAENKALKEENDQLKAKQVVAQQVTSDLERLRNALDMKEKYADYGLSIGANVIGRDYGNWSKIYTIDVGIKQNVQNNSVVLAGEGLVGHVEEATDISSKVVTLIDSQSAVGVEVSRTGDVGILKGDIELSNEGLCILEINGESEVVKNDQIITSYLSDVYPPGILVGKVEEVIVSSNDLVTYAYVRPVVDFEHLKQVLVLSTKSE